MLQKDTAICLRKTDYSDTSQVVTLFGRTAGKIAALAKGARRAKNAFDGPIELFSYGQIVYSERTGAQLCALTEFSQQPKFMALRSNLRALNAGMFAAELLESLTEAFDPHPELFDGLAGFLDDIQASRDEDEILKLLILFQLNLLREIGMAPVLDRCANSGAALSDTWPEVYFSSSANGILSPESEQAFVDKMRISKAAAACLSDLRRLRAAAGPVTAEIEKILIYHFTHILRRPPRMARHFLTR